MDDSGLTSCRMRAFDESGLLENGIDPKVLNRKLMHDMMKNGNIPRKDDHRMQTQSTQMISMHQTQLNQIDEVLQKENFFLTRNLDVERMIGQNDPMDQRMIVEICEISGLWDTNNSWFTKSRSFVQVEFKGILLNSKTSDNVTNPTFNELFIFPFSDQKDASTNNEKKLFISVFIVEGSGDIPSLLPSKPCETGSPPGPSEKDQNQYKRIAEICLDLEEVSDQLVHEMNLPLPVRELNPKAGPLQHTLRQCDISGLFDLEHLIDSSDEIRLQGDQNCSQSNSTTP